MIPIEHINSTFATEYIADYTLANWQKQTIKNREENRGRGGGPGSLNLRSSVT